MPVLSIDTTGKVASVAVVRNETVLAEFGLGLVRNHAASLLTMVDLVLREAKVEKQSLTHIAVSAGPGSFTGLRIGLSLAKGLAEGLNIPLVLVSTLEVLAVQSALHNGIIIPLLDAQRQEFYAAAFRASAGQVTRLCPDTVVARDNLLSWAANFSGSLLLTGEAAAQVETCGQFQVAPSFVCSPRAAVLGILSYGKATIEPHLALPNYIRSSSAKPKKEVSHGT